MTSVLCTGGIGDVIAIEAHTPLLQFESIYIAAPVHKQIAALLTAMGYQGNIKTLWIDEVFSWKCFLSKGHVKNTYDFRYWPLPKDWESTIDYSIVIRFPLIVSGNHPYRGTSLDQPATDPPFPYIACVPDSPRDRRNGRRFHKEDWSTLIDYLERHNLPAIVVNETGGQQPPDHPLVLDMTGQTSIAEGGKIIQHCRAYVGIDSCMSILAAKYNKPLAIKTNSENFLNWQSVYLAPRTTFDCVMPDLRDLDTFLAISP